MEFGVNEVGFLRRFVLRKIVEEYIMGMGKCLLVRSIFCMLIETFEKKIGGIFF